MGYSLVLIKNDRYDILSGKKEIGRVCQHADGSWIGVIGKYITVRGLATPKQAFNEAVAKHLRYDDSWKKQSCKAKSARQAKAAPIRVTQAAVVPLPVLPPFTATCAFMRPRA